MAWVESQIVDNQNYGVRRQDQDLVEFFIEKICDQVGYPVYIQRSSFFIYRMAFTYNLIKFHF